MLISHSEGVSSIVKVGVDDKLVKIEETINKLSKALLFDRVGKASNNPVLISFKCHSRSIEKESLDNFEASYHSILNWQN